MSHLRSFYNYVAYFYQYFAPNGAKICIEPNISFITNHKVPEGRHIGNRLTKNKSKIP